MKPTFFERKAKRREDLKHQVSPQTLMKNLKSAHSKLMRAERELAALDTSFGWNAVEGRRSEALAAYDSALGAIEERLFATYKPDLDNSSPDNVDTSVPRASEERSSNEADYPAP